MSDREALVAAIKAAPADDAPRLVFADWLDENGEADLAGFIRLQIDLAPLERFPDSDEARWQRAVIRSDLDAKVPGSFPAAMRRYAELAGREAAMLRAHRSRWLGPLNAVENNFDSHLRLVFRRGFIEEVGIATSVFLESGDLVRSCCPLLQKLVLYGPRDQGPELAACAALHGVANLELAGWITPFDARFLSTSLAIWSVHSLTLWIGSGYDWEVIRILATRPYEDTPDDLRGRRLTTGLYLRDLDELVLVQLHGGMAAGAAADVDLRAEALAAHFNQVLGRAVARVERPFMRRFPLNGTVTQGLHAGHARGRPVLICERGAPELVWFDSHGQLDRVESLELDPWDTADDEQFLDYFRRELGFEPGPIFIREFAYPDLDLGVYLFGSFGDVASDPDARSDGDEHEEACATLHGYWMSQGNFVIEYGTDYWAGPDGTIHSS